VCSAHHAARIPHEVLKVTLTLTGQEVI